MSFLLFLLSLVVFIIINNKFRSIFYLFILFILISGCFIKEEKKYGKTQSSVLPANNQDYYEDFHIISDSIVFEYLNSYPTKFKLISKRSLGTEKWISEFSYKDPSYLENKDSGFFQIVEIDTSQIKYFSSLADNFLNCLNWRDMRNRGNYIFVSYSCYINGRVIYCRSGWFDLGTDRPDLQCMKDKMDQITQFFKDQGINLDKLSYFE